MLNISLHPNKCLVKGVCQMGFSYGLCSDIGKRRGSNQDKLIIKTSSSKYTGDFGLFAVADGMGGMAEGGTAGEIAVENMRNWWAGLIDENIRGTPVDKICRELQKQFYHINTSIIKYGRTKEIKIGTTLSALFLVDSKYAICHIGDSRIYKLNNQYRELKQLTVDHTFVAEQVKMGWISPEEASQHPNRNILTQCLGVNREINTFISVGRIQKGDIFILCSDGLYNQVSADLMSAIVLEGIERKKDVRAIAQLLTKAANNNGGSDNISVIILGEKHAGKRQSLLGRLKNIF